MNIQFRFTTKQKIFFLKEKFVQLPKYLLKICIKTVAILISKHYTCCIAVGIPKTAIGVTAILLTAISETVMAAKN